MKKKDKDCYFCGSKSNGVEHVPGRQLFVGFNVDSVTVPSCTTHNGSKSHKDEAIVKALLKSLQTTSQNHNLHSDVIKAINNAKDHFGQVKSLVKIKALVEGESKGPFAHKIAWINDQAEIQKWMIQITAGWIWDALKKFDRNNHWELAKAFSFDHLQQRENETFSKEQLTRIVMDSHSERADLLGRAWNNGWSAHPREYPETIYKFKFLLQEGKMFFQHQFFNGSFIWFVEFTPSNETSQKIISILKKKHGG